MNREDIIRMAIEAGLNLYVNDLTEKQYIEVVEHFAALVASAEREACAKIVESDPSYDWHKFACEAANAIRARVNVATNDTSQERVDKTSEGVQEPVGWAEHGVINWLADKQFNHTSFLYDTPPQRTWVGLTDEEQKTISDLASANDWHDFDVMDATETKLKEKNND